MKADSTEQRQGRPWRRQQKYQGAVVGGAELVPPPQAESTVSKRQSQRADVFRNCWDSPTGSRGSNGNWRGRLLAQTLLVRIANTSSLLPGHGEGGTLWEGWTFSQHLYIEVVNTPSNVIFKYDRNKVKKINIRREIYQEKLTHF